MQWNRDIEHLLRSDDMMCLGGEEELSSMLMGNLAAFNRSDCELPAEEVFRWGWESWRAAVGGEIGRIYPHAIDVMNVGARANGEQHFSSHLFFYFSRKCAMVVKIHWSL